MIEVMNSFDEYKDLIFRLDHAIICELVETLPDTLTGDKTELSFEVPAQQFFHHYR
jgi:hypothetical protein